MRVVANHTLELEPFKLFCNLGAKKKKKKANFEKKGEKITDYFIEFVLLLETQWIGYKRKVLSIVRVHCISPNCNSKVKRFLLNLHSAFFLLSNDVHSSIYNFFKR